jgi:GxxExxY protein
MLFHAAVAAERRSQQGSMHENEVATAVLDAAFKIHRTLGPGMFEKVYEALLEHELQKAGLSVRRQVALPVVYDGIRFEEGFRIDLLVEECVIVEIKCVEQFAPVHFRQLTTYLRLADKRLGLLINFTTDQLRDGIKRVANNLR